MFNLQIDRSYADDWSTLREFLVRRSAVRSLECALRSYSRQLSDLQSRLSSLDSGGAVSFEGLRSDFSKVKSKVDSFLGVGSISEPAIVFGRSTSYSCGSVSVAPGAKIEVIPSLAHEYCHHVQMDYLSIERVSPVLCEGHAIGVELYVARRFSDETGNEAFLFSPLSRQVSRLKTSYIWVCANLGVRPDKSLVSCPSTQDSFELGFLRDSARPSSHAVGAAFFTLIPTGSKDSAYKGFLTGSLYF